MKINPSLDLTAFKDRNLKIALTAYHGYYSWHNIRQEYENNKLRYSCNNGRSFKKIVFPNGLYSYEDLNSYVDLIFKQEFLDKKPFIITFDTTIYKVSIEVFAGVVVDLMYGEFAKILVSIRLS